MIPETSPLMDFLKRFERLEAAVERLSKHPGEDPWYDPEPTMCDNSATEHT